MNPDPKQHPRRSVPWWAHGARAGNWLVLLALLSWLAVAGARPKQTQPQTHTPPPDGEWTANAVFTETRAVTDSGLGAVQGVAVGDGKVYAYGDVVSAKPRVGVIREYDLELTATGRRLAPARWQAAHPPSHRSDLGSPLRNIPRRHRPQEGCDLSPRLESRLARWKP